MRIGNGPDVYCELAEALLSMDKHLVAVAAHLHVCVDTIYEWRKVHPEFSYACSRGKAAGHAVFPEKVENAAWNPDVYKVNNTMVSLLAVNKYKMVTSKTAAKNDVNVKGKLNLSDAVRLRHENR